MKKKTDGLSEDKKQTGTSSDTVMEMRNIETLAKKQNIEENNKQNIKVQKNITVNNFKEVVDLFLQKKEILLFNNLFSHVHLVSFKKGKIEFDSIGDCEYSDVDDFVEPEIEVVDER